MAHPPGRNDGDVRLDGSTSSGWRGFEGNLWAGEGKTWMGLFLDERTDEAQRDGLQTICCGHVGGWPAEFAGVIGEVRGLGINPPGSEVGPGGPATWGRATVNHVDAFGSKWEWDGKSSKHIPFDWSGPS